MHVVVQMGREHEKKEPESLAAKQLKEDMKHMKMPRSAVKPLGCPSSKCRNPICQEALQIQRDLPFMDFESARECAIAERDLQDLKQQMKVIQGCSSSSRARRLRMCIRHQHAAYTFSAILRSSLPNQSGLGISLIHSMLHN